jgi:hypothetical protein
MTIERNMTGWNWFAFNWKRKEMRNNENLRMLFCQGIQSLVFLWACSCHLRILYVYRQTDCVACRAVCVCEMKMEPMYIKYCMLYQRFFFFRFNDQSQGWFAHGAYGSSDTWPVSHFSSCFTANLYRVKEFRITHSSRLHLDKSKRQLIQYSSFFYGIILRL